MIRARKYPHTVGYGAAVVVILLLMILLGFT